MHGIIKPQSSQDSVADNRWSSASLGWARRNRWFLIIVVLPTLLTAAYYYLVAADQYQSEAHFVIKTGDNAPTPSSGLGQLFGLSGGISQTRSDALSVNDYLNSQQAVIRLDRSLGLVERFRRPEADVATRLWFSEPTPESLLKYYRGQVDLTMNPDSGITALKVRTYRPADSFAIVDTLLRMGEARVNELNRRTQADTLSNARRQFADAENALVNIQLRMTSFRQQRGDLDPEGSGKAQITLVSGLQGQLTSARAQLSAMNGIIAPSSPQYVATAARVRALEAQVANQTGKLTVGSGAIAARLGNYQDLQIRQEFAAKRYEAAAANLERAREAAVKQQLYLIRVVDANMPVKSQFPTRGKVVLTVFLSLLLAYGIGWLLVAGVREHSL